MVNTLAGKLGGVTFKYFAEWTDRIAKGALPDSKPIRPQGVERNIVVTVRDWLTPKHYLHDLISTDRRYPTVNAYGPPFGSESAAERERNHQRITRRVRETHAVARAQDPLARSRIGP